MKGDAEKFYSGFYSLLLDNVLPSKFDETPDTNALMAEVATHLLIHLSGDKLECLEISHKPKPLSEKENKSLQYLAGFILHKLYSKFLYSTTINKRNTYQQYTSILQIM